ncbi:hypothetical protein [Flavobacterium ovatum]|uniref:hypothetical protein n=1 Tax=Flavobacterium ovatum TaxID=1928857 RepID=UPI0034500895
MKKSKLFVLGVVLLAVLMVSCHKDRKKLIDTWKVSEVIVKTQLSDSLKNDILTRGLLTFTKDGLVEGHLQRDFTDGIYILTEKGTSLTIKDHTGTPFTYESTITDDKIILEDDDLKLTLLPE